MKHFSHEHDLKLDELPPAFVTDVICQICNRSFAQDGPRCYDCTVTKCIYPIHIKCGELPQHINHSLHPLHPLTLANRPFNNTSISSSCCYLFCDKPFELNEGYTYACEQCSDFHMHRECAMIPLPTLITSSSADGGQPADQNFVQYACHQNPLILVEHDHDGGRKGESAQCFACHEIWSAPAYSCTSNECENFLHKSCADLKPKIYHPFHSRHLLRLQVSKPQSCRSCCKRNCALSFSCHEDGCKFNLCPKCSFLDTTVKCRSHDHLLSLVRNASFEIQCDACQKSYNWVDIVPDEINRTRSYLFRCMECEFNLHFLCGPLPSSIKYEYHIHLLILLDHLVTKDDSNEYYYCDICEEEMDPLFRSYYCENCKYVAHIHCLLFEIMEVINDQERRDVELTALGEHRWYRSHHIEGNTEEEFTLNDILDKLHPAEKAMLIDPVGSLHPEKKFLGRSLYNLNRRVNSRFEVKGSIEDIDRIQRFFCFEGEDNNLNTFWWELSTFIPEEGLKIEDKYLRQKVENVDGYMVPKTLSPILRTFISENEDFDMEESLTSEMKSITATLMCIVIGRMYRTKFEDVTWNDLKYWYFYLSSIKQITRSDLGNSSISDRLKGLVRPFLGREAIRCEKNTVKKLHSRIAELEADLERCKGLLEKAKGYDKSQASKYMKKGFKEASEFKQKSVADLVFG